MYKHIYLFPDELVMFREVNVCYFVDIKYVYVKNTTFEKKRSLIVL